MLERIQFPRIKTLDTSATPKAGERRITPKTLAEVDVSGIRSALAASAAENSPKPLSKTNVSADALALAEQRGFERGRRAGYDEGLLAGRMGGVALGLERARQAIDAIKLDNEESGVPVTVVGPAKAVEARIRPERRVPPPAPSGADPLLEAARQVWPVKMTWGGLAAMCGRKARGGHFNATRKRLIDTGVMREEGGLVVLAEPPQIPVGIAPADLLEMNLPQPAAKMFATIRRYRGISPQALADALQMQPRGGHWNNGLAILRRNALITEGDGLHIAKGLEASR